MFISSEEQAGQILRVLHRMTSESGAVAQTFADLLQKVVYCGGGPENLLGGEHRSYPSHPGCNTVLIYFVVPTSVSIVVQVHKRMLAEDSTTCGAAIHSTTRKHWDWRYPPEARPTASRKTLVAPQPDFNGIADTVKASLGKQECHPVCVDRGFQIR